MYATRKGNTLKCYIHSQSSSPCPISAFRSADERNSTLDALIGFCAGRGAQERITIMQQKRIIGALRKCPNPAFESARQALLDHLAASIRKYKTLGKGGQEGKKLRKEIDALLDELVDNPFQVWAPTIRDIDSDNNAILHNILVTGEPRQEHEDRRKTIYSHIYTRAPNAPMFTRSVKTPPPILQNTPSEDSSDNDECMEMKHKGPHNVPKVSLSQIQANAALQPSIPVPVHPSHIGELCRADSHATFATDINDYLHMDLHDNLTEIIEEDEEEKVQKHNKIVSTGHTVPLSQYLHLHSNCFPKDLAVPYQRQPLINEFIFYDNYQIDDASLHKVASNASVLLREPHQSRPLTPESTTLAWQRQRDKIFNDELRKRARDHRMGASPRAEERGWNANRMHDEMAQHIGKKRQKNFAENEKADEKIKRSLKAEHYLRNWTTKRMIDEQKWLEEEARSQDNKEVREARANFTQEQRKQFEKQQKAAEEKALAQAHREKAFTPDSSNSNVARSVMGSRERGLTMDGLDEAIATANKVQARKGGPRAKGGPVAKGGPAADAGKKKGPRVRFEFDTDKSEKKRKGLVSKNAQILAKGKKAKKAEEDAWEDEDDYQDDGKKNRQDMINQAKAKQSILKGKAVMVQDKVEASKDDTKPSEDAIETNRTADGKSCTSFISKMSSFIPSFSRTKTAVQPGGQSKPTPIQAKVETADPKTSSNTAALQSGQPEFTMELTLSKSLFLDSKPYYGAYGSDNGHLARHSRSPRCSWGSHSKCHSCPTTTASKSTSSKTTIQDYEDVDSEDDSDSEYVDKNTSNQTPSKKMLPDYTEPSCVSEYGVDNAFQTISQAKTASPMTKFPGCDEPHFEPEPESGPSAAKATPPRTLSSTFNASSHASEPDTAYPDSTIPTIRATPVTSAIAPWAIFSRYKKPEVVSESDESDEEWDPDWIIDKRVGQYSPGGTRIV